MNEQAHSHHKFFYFVGEDKYETDQESITGAQIKARIPNLEPSMGLSLEGQGSEPDRMIGDADSVTLEIGHGDGPRRFTLVPPATFG